MSNKILPRDKLLKSERLFYAGSAYVLACLGLAALGLFLHFPWLVGGFVVVLFCLEVQRRRRRPAPNSGIHGTAHLASDEEIESAGLTGRSDGLILGKLPRRTNRPGRPLIFDILRTRFDSVDGVARMRRLISQFVMPENPRASGGTPNLVRLPCSDKHSHLAVYFATGIGKSFKSLIPNLYVCDENAVVYDPSGETVRLTAEHRHREFGHDIRVIDPFLISGVRQTDRINVLDQVGPNDPGAFDYCNHLGHALVIEKSNSNQDPFWHAGTVSATGFLIHAIMMMGGKNYRSLVSLGELLNAERFHELAGALAEHPDTALRRRAQQMRNFRAKTLDSLLACLTAEHGWLDSEAFADTLSASTFSVRSLYERKLTIYIVTPGHRSVESRPFLRTLLTAMLYAGFEAGPDIRRPPVRFYLDEAATLGKLDLLLTLYTQGRKFGMRSMNYFQSLGQVAEKIGSPDKVQTFRSQMAGELFKANDYQTAKEVSDWIGNTTVPTVSTSWQQGTNSGWSHSDGRQGSNSRSGGSSQSVSTTVSETGVLAVRPEEILQLNDNEALFISAGTPPVRLNILD